VSFILDALKKSETDRQRQSGPALFEVKVARPRARLPLWAVAIAVLLAVNLAVAAWVLWRHSSGGTAVVGPAPAVNAPGVPAMGSAPLPAASLSQAGPGTAAPLVPAGPASATVSPASAAANARAAPPASASAEAENAEDYAAAREPAPAFLGSHVRRGTEAGVPLYQDAAATPGVPIPQLRLDLHAYADRPQDRWVMINMHKLHEGDSLPEGVHVDSITREGAVLSYNGSRFLLPRD